MKKALAIWFYLSTLIVEAQKYDYHWMIGLSARPANPIDTDWSVTHFDFNQEPVSIYRQYWVLDMTMSGMSACDKYGNLQFATDGITVHNRNDQQMPNGFGLNPGQPANDNIPLGGAYPNPKGCMVIPKPGNDSVYYLFHTAWRYDNAPQLSGVLYTDLYRTTVDMRLQNGLGDVTEKNYPLIADSIVGAGGLAACKHANGRDWWIIVPKIWSTCFYTALVTPNGIDTIFKQYSGDTVHVNNGTGSVNFSPDGTHYVWGNFVNGLNILDFDRCTGELSNAQHIAVTDSFALAANGSYLPWGIAISPNSKYLYLTSGTQVRQYNLTADSIAESAVLIDNTLQGTPQTSVEYGQLGPDGKIYINAVGQDTFMHIINNPDVRGIGCNFVRRAIHLPTYDFSTMPYYPNYRLGPLEGSACDSLPHVNDGVNAINSTLQKLNVYPNPAAHTITIDYNFTDWNKGQPDLEITNPLGQTVYRQTLPRYSGYQKIDVTNYPPGVYAAFIKRDGKMVAAGRFVKE